MAYSNTRPKRLKIVMALENYSYPQDVRVRGEAEALAAAGHRVLVLAPKGASQRARESVNGVQVKRYRLLTASGTAGILLEYLLAVVQLTFGILVELARGAEVIHLHNPPDLLFPAGWLARAIGRIVIFDHHDLAPELFEQKYGAGGWRASILRWCERMTMRVAHVVLAANESHRRLAIQRGHVDPGQVVVVRNAPRQSTIASVPLTRTGVLTDPRLCYVGSLGSQDGVAILPEIVGRLCRIGSNPALRIAGDGPELPRIRRLAKEHDVLDRIDFLGYVPHEQIPRIIAEADICLDVAPCTPLNHQSTMIKIGEYLAAGRPIVTFALQETRYTARECALYVDCNDLNGYCESIMRLCADEHMRASLSAQALERVHELTWERSAEHLHHAYAIATDSLARSSRSGRDGQALRTDGLDDATIGGRRA